MKPKRISTQDRIIIYQEAIHILRDNYFIGWCFALDNSSKLRELNIPSPYMARNMRRYFPDLLKYSLKAQSPAYRDAKSYGYLFPTNKKGYLHRVNVLQYRIKELKRKL